MLKLFPSSSCPSLGCRVPPRSHGNDTMRVAIASFGFQVFQAHHTGIGSDGVMGLPCCLPVVTSLQLIGSTISCTKFQQDLAQFPLPSCAHPCFHAHIHHMQLHHFLSYYSCAYPCQSNPLRAPLSSSHKPYCLWLYNITLTHNLSNKLHEKTFKLLVLQGRLTHSDAHCPPHGQPSALPRAAHLERLPEEAQQLHWRPSLLLRRLPGLARHGSVRDDFHRPSGP